MDISVFGAGYVGLVQAAVLANVGHNVICVDTDPDRIENLNKGVIPIYEPGLEGMVRENAKAGRLVFTADAPRAVSHGEVIFIAVGTPPDSTGRADLSHVWNVAETIGRHMDGDTVVINKSTVPVGTVDEIKARIGSTLRARGVEGLHYDVVANPEFLKQGSAVSDCQRPDRIIVGTDDPVSRQVVYELYAPFNRNHEKILMMDARSAELTKYAANCILATKISFMNEMANLAEHLGADIEMVRKGIGSDPRIGYDFIYPGCGYGGSCLPKDIRALKETARQVGYEARIIQAVEGVNESQRRKLFDLIARHYGDDLRGKVFALWGLAFKANTNDMREAPSRVLMELLWQASATVKAYDPEAMDECRRLYGNRPDLRLEATKEATLEGANALIIVTDWQSFKAPDFRLLRRQLKDNLIFDGRNLYDPQAVRRHGVNYVSIGRSAV